MTNGHVHAPLGATSPGGQARRYGPADGGGSLLWQAANAWSRRLRAAVTPHDLTQAQFLLLAGLARLEARAGEPITQAGLAKACGIDVTMASTVLRQLAAARLLSRRQGADARSRALALSAAGRSRLEAALPDVDAAEAAFFRALSADLGAFKGALSVLIGRRPRLAAPSARATTPRSP